MSCLTDLRFNTGDPIIVPFHFQAGGTGVDITGGIVSAELWSRGIKVLTLNEGAGIAIIDASADADPQGTATLTPIQGAALPFGRLSYLKFVFVDVLGVEQSSEPVWLNRVLP